MFRYFIVAACLAVPVFSYSSGAPQTVCSNGLVPEHHLDGQTSTPPYSFSGANAVRSGGKISLTLGGGNILGFAIQARDAQENPIGEFKIVESTKSQTIRCSGPNDTLTHKKIPEDNPLKRLEFEWIAPSDYTGNVKFVATVAEDYGTFWISKVLKDVKVE